MAENTLSAVEEEILLMLQEGFLFILNSHLFFVDQVTSVIVTTDVENCRHA